MVLILLCCTCSTVLFWGPQRSQCHDFDIFCVVLVLHGVVWGPQHSQRHDFDTSVLCWFYSVVLGSTAFSES